MRISVQYRLDDPEAFVRKLIHWSAGIQPFCLLNNNGFTAQNNTLPATVQERSFDVMAGAGAVHELKALEDENGFKQLRSFSNEQQDWLMGFLTYDLKNHNENLDSANFDGIGFPLLHFFVPRYLFMVRQSTLTVHFLPSIDTEDTVEAIFKEILDTKEAKSDVNNQPAVRSRISREEYLQKVEGLRAHIHRGDIYEVNFCQEFYAEKAAVDPRCLYNELNAMSPAPFSAYYAHAGRYLLSASPERYLRKTADLLYSQPIKGTARRGKNREEDEALKNTLQNDPKERSENVMIVDLVRNDLSRTACRGSVKVEELFGVYTFPQVHQLISTVRSQLRPGVHPIEAISNSFPMGSMTGAPKFRAMQLIEEYEESKRGLFSGAVGYFTPEKDFDFNVVIRSIQYHAQNRYLSFTVGGAITALCDPEKEYEECLLKARAMLNVLGVTGERSINT